MKSKYPTSHYTLKKDCLNIRLLLRPTEHSKVYTVKIIFKGMDCKVWLLDNIKKLDAEDFPHCYKKEKNRVQLCLLHPDKFEWSMVDWVQDTIIPWTIEWLFYYELWLCTREWYGGGEHPAGEIKSEIPLAN